MAVKAKFNKQKLSTPEQIKTLANKKGVTILLDMDSSSEEAKNSYSLFLLKQIKNITNSWVSFRKRR
jgi:5S rRNA maturation endonuclease (ribonuclease M5)